jgi:hypothetical protein
VTIRSALRLRTSAMEWSGRTPASSVEAYSGIWKQWRDVRLVSGVGAGHFQTSARVPPRSAQRPGTDIVSLATQVRKVPMADRRPLDQTAAIVCTSTRKASLTSRSTMRSVFGGYFPSGNIFGNSRRRNAMNLGISCEWTRYVVN